MCRCAVLREVSRTMIHFCKMSDRPGTHVVMGDVRRATRRVVGVVACVLVAGTKKEGTIRKIQKLPPF